ncbi:uncharacterized protein SPSC_04461 [Sporisorium scitamineum]|uniref:Uncharacterized protein n=1 Tax=Sporisorium scitamineum TaxID=49012 RepID=A0A127ZES9_9BASI|nr:uncharacterized protein SPSC_04461 [Sporisorium scitamineum]
MTDSKSSLIRSTSIKLQRMFSSRRGQSVEDRPPTIRGARRREMDSRTGLDMQRPSTPSSSSDSSSFHTSSSSSSSSSSSINSFDTSKPPPSNPAPQQRLIIRASTFEWTWNWDDNWCLKNLSRENLQVAQEVAPVFPRSFESSSKVVVGEEVSPMSSAVDLSLTRLGRLPRWVLGQEEEVWMCSYFSDDDNNDDEEEEDEERNNTTTFTVRRKPPPAFPNLSPPPPPPPSLPSTS